MRATQQDRTIQPRQKSNTPPLIAGGIVLLLIAAGVYFFLPDKEPTFKPSPIEQTPEEVMVPLPEIPFITIEEPDFILPILDESDGDFRTRLIDVSDELAPWLQSEELIRRGVTFNDGLSRGEVLSNLLSLPAPEGKFRVATESDGIYISEENYQRYDYLQRIFSSTDPKKLASLFHLFRPLLEQAYGELGYDPKTLGAAIIFTLDKILATPVIEEPIMLALTTVHYSYADPALENLNPLQKQLLRMGPASTRIIQQKALIIKQNLLLETPQTTEE